MKSMLRIYSVLLIFFIFFNKINHSHGADLCPSDLKPDQTYFILANVQKPSYWWDVRFLTPGKLKKIILSTESASIATELEIHTGTQATDLDPILPLLHMRSPADPELDIDPEMIASITREVERHWPGASHIDITPLGFYGTGNVIQIRPEFIFNPVYKKLMLRRPIITKGDRQYVVLSLKLTNGTPIEPFFAETHALTFKYTRTPDTSILLDRVTTSLRRGDWTFPAQFREINVQHPTMTTGIDLLGLLSRRELNVFPISGAHSQLFGLHPHFHEPVKHLLELTTRSLDLSPEKQEPMTPCDSPVITPPAR